MTHARRVQAIRSRARIRRWEYRQRNLSHGAWAKFREALALASDAYAIDATTSARLVDEGFTIDPRGQSLEPARRIIWITPGRAAELEAPPLKLCLDATLLSAVALALVPFPSR